MGDVLKLGVIGQCQSGDGGPLPQRECGPKLDEQFAGGGEKWRKPRDWNLFTRWRGIDAG